MSDRFIKSVFLLLTLCFFSSCSLLGSGSEQPASRVKLPAREAIMVEKAVSYSDLKLSLSNEIQTSKLRAVEVFQNTSGINQGSSSYRLFDIAEGSVYHLLGLANADILVAINERTMANPYVLGQVVRLLPNEKSIQFEIIRSGKSYLLKIKFV